MQHRVNKRCLQRARRFEETQAMKRVALRRAECGLVSLMLALLCLACSGQQLPEAIVDRFLLAMVENHSTALLGLTTPGAQQFAQDWMESHSPFHCKTQLLKWEKEKVEISGGEPAPSDEGKLLYNALYRCQQPDSVYFLAVREILLVPHEKTWRVEQWGDVCEAHDYGVCE